MDTSLKISPNGAVDFLALGALVHRLDPGIVPFRKASSCSVHVSGGEFNCTANLADCFGMRTAIASAMVDYPIGEFLEEVRLTGDTILCPCGARTLPEDLKKTPGVNLAQMAIVFTGNRGWLYEVRNDRDAFKDEEFLATIEQALGTKVDVIAVGY